VLSTAGKVCYFGDNKEQPCEKDADCAYSGPPIQDPYTHICGGTVGSNYDTCANTKIGRCATAAKICVDNANLTAFNSTAWFNMTLPAYKQCFSSTDCPANATCLPLSQAGGEKGGCTNDTKCQAGNTPGKCIQYDTAHLRRCNPAGSKDNGVSNQCQYEKSWTQCQPLNSCGDGIVDPGKCSISQKSCTLSSECGTGEQCLGGEECDDGSANATYNACTTTCKKNTCGDSNLWLGVEECDNGANNGQKVCKAEYQSSCNDCNLTCKNMTAAGGYCGDNTINGKEQCDGNDQVTIKDYTPSVMTVADYMVPHYILQTDLGSAFDTYPAAKMYMGTSNGVTQVNVMKNSGPITCKALGYDYAIYDLSNVAIKVTNALHTQDTGPNGLFTQYWGAEATQIHNEIQQGHPPVVLPVVKKATQMNPMFQYQDMALLNTIMDVCGLITKEKEYAYPGVNQQFYVFRWKEPDQWPSKEGFWSCIQNKSAMFGVTLESQANDKPYCGLDCAITGCGRCIDQGGTGKIGGTVRRNGGSGYEIAIGARVTLQYNGLNVSQVFTDGNGRFDFTGLNEHAECTGYRLIADITIDGAYDTVTSNEFGTGNYSTQVVAHVHDNVSQEADFPGDLVLPNSDVVGQTPQ
jgi:hypothetical protein